MDSSNFDYDLVVIGSGPAGQRAAIQAAKLDKRVRSREIVAIFSRPRVERSPLHLILGDHLVKLCLHQGDIRSDLLRGASKATPRSDGAADRRAASDPSTRRVRHRRKGRRTRR